MLDLVVVAMLAEAPTVGHVKSPNGSATLSTSNVFNSYVNISLGSDGHWRGRFGHGAVDWALKSETYRGDPSFVLDGEGVEVVFVHHIDQWYARGWIRGTPVTVIWPDGKPISGWFDYTFDGIAAQPSPPFVPLVLAIYVSQVNSRGVVEKGIDFAPGRGR